MNRINDVKFNLCGQSVGDFVRRINTQDITFQPVYQIEVFAQGLFAPSSMVFDRNGDLIIGESGYIDGKAKVIRISEGRRDVLTEDIEAPITDLTYDKEDLYLKGKLYFSNGTATNSGVVGIESFTKYTCQRMFDLI